MSARDYVAEGRSFAEEAARVRSLLGEEEAARVRSLLGDGQ